MKKIILGAVVAIITVAGIIIAATIIMTAIINGITSSNVLVLTAASLKEIGFFY